MYQYYKDMTRFERTRVISARALQISMGAPILIRTKAKRPEDIAEEEFSRSVLPITVIRHPPKKI